MCCEKQLPLTPPPFCWRAANAILQQAATWRRCSVAAPLKRNANGNVNGNGKANKHEPCGCCGRCGTWVGACDVSSACHLPPPPCCTYLYVYIFLRFINFYISLAVFPWILRRKLYDVLCGESGCKSCSTAERGRCGGGGGVMANLSCSKVPLALAYVAHINFHFVASFHWFRTEIE